MLKNNSKVEPREVIDFPLSCLHACVLHFDAIDSTNNFLKEYAQEKGPENLDPRVAICALADEQTAGRGRLGRSWHSPRGAGIYFSILLKPRLKPGDAPLLTLMAAMATLEAVGANCRGPLDIKWPNDILLKGKKVAGILSEAGFESDRLNYAVLGFGINLNQKEFPEEIRDRATSLFIETGKEIDRDLFLAELLARIDTWYGVLLSSPEKIIESWQQNSSYAHDKLVQVDLDDRKIRVRTCGLDSNGALRVQKEDGSIVTIYGGEIFPDGE